MKHNVFLGSSSGSVGDLTSYRREGVQVSRLRLREIKNPRTYNQAEQRNFLAPVAKFYAPLAEALEQSFEGKSTAKSYAAFSSEAVKKARNNGWYLPKGTQFYPLPYQLSQGTIQPLDQVIANGKFAIALTAVGTAEASVTTMGDFAAAMIAVGYQSGDQLTIIKVMKDSEGNFYPKHSRLFLNAESTDLISDAFGLTLGSTAVGDTEFSFTLPSSVVAVAVIVSRWDNDKWRRSTQTLLVTPDVLTAVTSALAKENAIASYMNGQYVPISDIYLNGSTQA